MVPQRSLRVRVLPLILAFSIGPSSAGTIYKWVDANGVVHYGDQSPQGQRAEQIHIQTPRQTAVDTTSGGPTTPEELTPPTSVVVSESRPLPEAQAPPSQDNPELCNKARSDLTVLHENARVLIDENGTQRYLTPEERSERISALELIMRETCGWRAQK